MAITITRIWYSWTTSIVSRITCTQPFCVRIWNMDMNACWKEGFHSSACPKVTGGKETRIVASKERQPQFFRKTFSI